jgi:hypothetical protein
MANSSYSSIGNRVVTDFMVGSLSIRNANDSKKSIAKDSKQAHNQKRGEQNKHNKQNIGGKADRCTKCGSNDSPRTQGGSTGAGIGAWPVPFRAAGGVEKTARRQGRMSTRLQIVTKSAKAQYPSLQPVQRKPVKHVDE